ncbi:MAG: energy transducer TonB [Sterolibacterium sp.]
MKFKSISTIGLGRALLISLALHAILLWQTPSATLSGMPQPLSSTQANFLSASLRTNIRQQMLATNSLSAPAPKSSVVPHPIKLPPKPLPMGSPSIPQVPLTAAFAKPGEDGLDANGLRQYRVSLATAARRFKLYPPLALENGWSGTAEIVVANAANGVPQPVQLLRSSGYALLDAAALEMVGNAALHAAVPASLRGQTFSVLLPVVFDLNGEQ